MHVILACVYNLFDIDEFQDFVTSEHRQIFEEYVDSAREGRETKDLHFSLTTKHQGPVEMTIKTMTQKNDLGGFAFVICVGQNCVDFVRKRCDSFGLKSDLQMLTETANSPIVGTDADGLVNEWNSTMTMISGIARDAIIGKSFVQVARISLIAFAARSESN